MKSCLKTSHDKIAICIVQVVNMDPRAQISWLTGYVLGIPKNGPGRSMTKVGYSFSGENYIFMVVIHINIFILNSNKTSYLTIRSVNGRKSKDF